MGSKSMYRVQPTPFVPAYNNPFPLAPDHAVIDTIPRLVRLTYEARRDATTPLDE